jgi:hypothetical protein
MTEGQIDPSARAASILAARAAASSTPRIQYVVVNANGVLFEKYSIMNLVKGFQIDRALTGN